MSPTPSPTGIDVDALVSQLMTLERRPEVLLQARRNTATQRADALKAVKALLSSMATTVGFLDAAADWQPLTATSTNAAVAVSATRGTAGGTLTFTVDQRATSHAAYTASSAGASTPGVVAVPSLLLAAGGQRLGFGVLGAGDALSMGRHTIEVTQASAAASISGTAVGPSTAIDASNDTIELEVDGQAVTITLAHGTYGSPSALADAVNAAVADHPGAPGLVASAGADGRLTLATTREGSAATLALTGGSGLAPLGLGTASTAGTDAVVTIGGVTTAVTDLRAGDTIDLAATAGTITATLSGGLRAGSVNATNVAAGDGSLSAVAAAINAAQADVSATLVGVGGGAFRLQLSSKVSGAAGGINVDPAAFAGLGGLATLTNGTDARITVGGEAPYSITSSSNTFEELLPGVSITLTAAAAGPVTITARRDDELLANRVQSLVEGLNRVLDDVRAKIAVNAATGTGAVLTGEPAVRQLTQQLTNALAGPVVGSTRVAGTTGINLGREGRFTFDRAAFLTALGDDPAGVQRLFLGDEDEPGIAGRLTAAVAAATGGDNGYLGLAEKAQRDRVDRATKDIDAMQVRFELREQSLRSKYVAMNTALSRLQSDSTSLLAQLAQFNRPAQR